MLLIIKNMLTNIVFLCIISTIMLSKLLASKVRAEILSLLMCNPDERFYVREIATMLGKNPSGVKRELDNLEEVGVLKSEKVANLKYFSANKQSPLFNELMRFVVLATGFEDAIRYVLIASAAKIGFFFGEYDSTKKGLNLFVVGGVSSLAERVKRIAREFSAEVSITHLSEADFEKQRREQDESLKKIIEQKRVILLGRI